VQSAALHHPADHHHQKDKPSKICFANNSTTNHPTHKPRPPSYSPRWTPSNGTSKKFYLIFLLSL